MRTTVHVQVIQARATPSLHQGHSCNLRVMAGLGVMCTLCQAVMAHIWLQAEQSFRSFRVTEGKKKETTKKPNWE